MKNICVFAMLFAACAVAQDKIPAVPKDAQPQNYSYTDAQGTKWTVRHTPFAVLRLKESDLAPVAAPSSASPLTVTDLGDSIRFERNYPFGHNVWTTKKSDLNDAEKGLLAAAGTGAGIPQGQADRIDKTGDASSPASTEKK